MKKYFPVLSVAVFVLLVTLACRISVPDVEIGYSGIRGSGDVIEEERSVSGISRVRVANQGDLFIQLGDEEALIIEAEDNLIDYIESDVRNGELVLETRRNINIRNEKPIRYYLTVKELQAIAISSSGDIEAPEFEVDRFSIDVNSSGDVDIDGLVVEKLDVNISSSGDVVIGELYAEYLEVDTSSSGNLTIHDGEIEEQDISISSSGDYDGRDVQSQRADVRLSSSGNATIRVSDELEANLSSSGDLYYIGNLSVDARQSSSGDVVQIND